MARGVNKVILIGNVGGDPETRSLPNGNAVTNLTLATSETWKDKQTGQSQERTEWHRVVFFGKIAEIAGEYVRKGSQIYVEGSLRTRKWQDQSGQDRYTTEVVVDINGQMQLLGSRNSQEGSAPSRAQQPAPQSNRPRQDQGQGEARRAVPAMQPEPDYDSFDDDIPFMRINDRLALMI